MVEVKFRIKGREVASGDFANAIEASVFRQLKERITKRLDGVKCPEHSHPAKVTAEGEDLEHLTWKVSGCCEKVREQALQALRG